MDLSLSLTVFPCVSEYGPRVPAIFHPESKSPAPSQLRTIEQLAHALTLALSKIPPMDDGVRTGHVVNSDGKVMVLKSIHSPDRPEDLFHYWMLDEIESGDMWRLINRFPPPTQDRFDMQMHELRQNGYYSFQRDIASRLYVLFAAACKDQRVQCSLCTIPFSSCFDMNAWFTAKNCQNCKLREEVTRNLTRVLDDLDKAAQSDCDIGPFTDAVKAFKDKIAISKIHVRSMHCLLYLYHPICCVDVQAGVWNSLNGDDRLQRATRAHTVNLTKQIEARFRTALGALNEAKTKSENYDVTTEIEALNSIVCDDSLVLVRVSLFVALIFKLVFLCLSRLDNSARNFKDRTRNRRSEKFL